MAEKVVLVNDLSPGDILLMSIAIRSLHKAYPDRFITDVRSPCNEIFMFNPYVVHIDVPDPKAANEAIETLKKNDNHPPVMVGDTKYVISHYPEIHRSGMTGLPFADGHRMFLEKQLDLSIPRTGMKPDIFFSETELQLPRQVEGRYWIVNAGIKNDYTLKYYHRYQEVIDLLKDKIQFVQIGHLSHNHPPLSGVLDLRGKTTLRQLFLLTKYADGSVCPVSLQMVISAALSKPCVVVAGAREGVRWQINPDHRFLYMNGAMKCAPYDGCWRSKKEECTFKTKDKDPMCMELIRPEDIARAIELYYLGGALAPLKEEPVILDLKGEKPMGVDKNILDSVPVLKDGTIIDVKDPNFFPKLEESIKNVVICEPIPLETFSPQVNSAIFNTLRILKKENPRDMYFEAYKGHYAKRGDKFMDTYHFMWYLGAIVKPKRILEIGTRTGISLCQLLSATLDYDKIEKIILCDTFTEPPATPQVVLSNLRYLNIPVVPEFIVGSSLEEIPKLKEEFDYILVDGCHDKDYARQDLFNATKIIAPLGYIVFDDLTPDGCSLQDVWDEFKLLNADKFIFGENHNGKGVGYAKRNA